MPNMNYSHFNHSIIANNDFLFVIGGFYNNKCEYFNFSSFKWEEIQEINEKEIQKPMLFLYLKYLYSFNGYNQYEIYNKIYRININDLNNSIWESLTLNSLDIINLKFYGSALFISNNELYFIGGSYVLDIKLDNFKKDVFVYDFNKNLFFNKNLSLPDEIMFNENKLHLLNEKIIGNFYYDKNYEDILGIFEKSSLEI